MSYHAKQFRGLIERTLASLDPTLASESAVLLLLGTAAQESKFGMYLLQVNGPAIGAFQMEPDTFRWLTDKYRDEYPFIAGRYPREMEWDLRLAIVMARLRYRVVPAALPSTDPINLAAYWKQHYNTAAGAGTPEEFLFNWKKYVEGRV
jgi:hypothetical protein